MIKHNIIIIVTVNKNGFDVILFIIIKKKYKNKFFLISSLRVSK